MFKKLSLATILLFSISNVFGMTPATRNWLAEIHANNKDKIVVVVKVSLFGHHLTNEVFDQLQTYNNEQVGYFVLPANLVIMETVPAIYFFKNSELRGQFRGNSTIEFDSIKSVIDELIS